MISLPKAARREANAKFPVVVNKRDYFHYGGIFSLEIILIVQCLKKIECYAWNRRIKEENWARENY